MYESIKHMLDKYDCNTEQDYLNALKEIFQEIALLGLWRVKFYEVAAFYGGSALRILYGLDRFSEDLDFTLLTPEKHFDLEKYNQAVADELKSFGFEVEVLTKHKSKKSAIESAFIKANSKKQMIVIKAPPIISQKIHRHQTLKIKMEVDTNPPGQFSTEVKNVLQPGPFSVKTLMLPDLFAGKVHALLCRPWQQRIKGRDWYDFIWYIGRNIPINLTHLRERLIQSNALKANETFNKTVLTQLLAEKIATTDFDSAKIDVIPFLKDSQSIELWSKLFFSELLTRLTYL